MKEEQAEEQEQEHEELGVYLLDIAASTFAIMLIYLLMVASQASDVQQQKVETSHYKPKDPQTQDFTLRTWRPLHLYRDNWVLQNGILLHLNFAAIARAFQEKGPGLIYSSENGTVYAERGPEVGAGSPTEFSIRFEAGQPVAAAAGGAVDRFFAAETFIAANGTPNPDAMAQLKEPLDIHVIGNPRREDYTFLRAVQGAKLSTEVYFDDSGSFTVSRQLVNYALNKIYR